MSPASLPTCARQDFKYDIKFETTKLEKKKKTEESWSCKHRSTDPNQAKPAYSAASSKRSPAAEVVVSLTTALDAERLGRGLHTALLTTNAPTLFLKTKFPACSAHITCPARPRTRSPLRPHNSTRNDHSKHQQKRQSHLRITAARIKQPHNDDTADIPAAPREACCRA
ncbi:hypothetical protein BKA80DRAFT_142134 [Phyllosticta citrichinensis]